MLSLSLILSLSHKRHQHHHFVTLADFSRPDPLCQIEEQRKYLGGDAEHSILVKGLDFGLLAAKKAELEAKEGGKYEAELDDLLDGGLGVEMKEDVRPIEIASKKRSRDEIMAELKGKKSKTSAVEAKQPPKDSGLGSKVSFLLGVSIPLH